MKLGLLGDALLLRRWKLLLLWNAFLPWRMKILLLWNRSCCTVAACRDPIVRHSFFAVEGISAMESKVLYGRGMPRPISMPFFFGG